MSKCGECKYWQADGICQRIPWREDGSFVPADHMAYIAGGYDEGTVELVTKAEFGCVLWEPE